MIKVKKIAYWVSTVLVCLLMLASASMYIFNYDEVRDTFDKQLNFPVWLIYPMAIAKISAVVMLASKFNRSLTEWAYAGLTFNMLLAIGAHVAKEDEQALPAIVGLLLVLTSYFTWKSLERSTPSA